MFRYLITLLLIAAEVSGFEASGTPLSTKLKARMIAAGSFHEGCPVPLEKLRLVALDHYTPDGTIRKGVLVVHEDVADEVVKIFHTLYEARFPIVQMRPVSDFNASDEASMRANNTSAFNCRYIAHTTKFSNHSYGRAIDINPLFNPCVQKGEVSPANARAYLNRQRPVAGMIDKEGIVVKTFAKYGWRWGGMWRTLKDYQHFEKRR